MPKHPEAEHYACLNNLPWKYNGSVADDNRIITQARKNIGLKARRST